MTHELSKERLEEIANFESDLVNKPFIYEDARRMARELPAAHEQEPVVVVAGFDAATAIRACMEEFPECMHDIVEECAQIAENTISITHPAPSIPPSREPDAWQYKSYNGKWLDLMRDDVEEAKTAGYEVRGLWASLPAPSIPAAVPDEQAAFEVFMESNFRESIDRRKVKNGDGEYFAWDMQVAWKVWQERAMQGNSPVIPDDTRRMDWLVSKTVNVREPLVYGSHDLFWSQTISDDWEEEHKTTLREQIDAAMAAAPKGV